MADWQKRWIRQISPEDFYIYEIIITTYLPVRLRAITLSLNLRQELATQGYELFAFETRNDSYPEYR